MKNDPLTQVIITRKNFKSWATYLLSKLSSQNFMNKSGSNFRVDSEKNMAQGSSLTPHRHNIQKS